jgi:hypothetical protein
MSKTRPRRESAAISEGLGALLTLAGRLVAGGQSGNSDVKNAGHMYVVPFLFGERMDTIIHHQALAFVCACRLERVPERAAGAHTDGNK